MNGVAFYVDCLAFIGCQEACQLNVLYVLLGCVMPAKVNLRIYALLLENLLQLKQLLQHFPKTICTHQFQAQFGRLLEFADSIGDSLHQHDGPPSGSLGRGINGWR